MKKSWVILLADRNPRIRDYLQRELRSDVYKVVTAQNAEQLYHWIHRGGRLDVLVIDPDMAGLQGEKQLSRMLLDRPRLPVIFHCLISDYCALKCPEREVYFIEKSGQSVDLLKQQLNLILVKHFAHRENCPL